MESIWIDKDHNLIVANHRYNIGNQKYSCSLLWHVNLQPKKKSHIEDVEIKVDFKRGKDLSPPIIIVSVFALHGICSWMRLKMPAYHAFWRASGLYTYNRQTPQWTPAKAPGKIQIELCWLHS